MSRVQVIVDGQTRLDQDVDACTIVTHHPKEHGTRDNPAPWRFELFCHNGYPGKATCSCTERPKTS